MAPSAFLIRQGGIFVLLEVDDQGALALLEQPLLLEEGHHARHPLLVVGLAPCVFERDPEEPVDRLELGLADLDEACPQAPRTRVAVLQPLEPRAGPILEVATGLAILGDLAVDADVERVQLVGLEISELRVAPVEFPREEELAERRAPVAEVVDPHHAPVPCPVDLAQAVPDHRRPQVVERQGLGHVGTRVVHDHRLALALPAAAVRRALGHHGLQGARRQGGAIHPHVHVGAFGHGRGDAVARLEGRGNLRRDLRRRHPALLRQLEAGHRELPTVGGGLLQKARDPPLVQSGGLGQTGDRGFTERLHRAPPGGAAIVSVPPPPAPANPDALPLVASSSGPGRMES